MSSKPPSGENGPPRQAGVEQEPSAAFALPSEPIQQGKGVKRGNLGDLREDSAKKTKRAKKAEKKLKAAAASAASPSSAAAAAIPPSQLVVNVQAPPKPAGSSSKKMASLLSSFQERYTEKVGTKAKPKAVAGADAMEISEHSELSAPKYTVHQKKKEEVVVVETKKKKNKKKKKKASPSPSSSSAPAPAPSSVIALPSQDAAFNAKGAKESKKKPSAVAVSTTMAINSLLSSFQQRYKEKVGQKAKGAHELEVPEYSELGAQKRFSRQKQNDAVGTGFFAGRPRGSSGFSSSSSGPSAYSALKQEFAAAGGEGSGLGEVMKAAMAEIQRLTPPRPHPTYPFDNVDLSTTTEAKCELMVAESLLGREECLWTIKSCFDFFMKCTNAVQLVLPPVSAVSGGVFKRIAWQFGCLSGMSKPEELPSGRGVRLMFQKAGAAGAAGALKSFISSEVLDAEEVKAQIRLKKKTSSAEEEDAMEEEEEEEEEEDEAMGMGMGIGFGSGSGGESMSSIGMGFSYGYLQQDADDEGEEEAVAVQEPEKKEVEEVVVRGVEAKAHKFIKSENFEENKIKSGFGFNLLKKFGWKEGQGVGSSMVGAANPLAITSMTGKLGLMASDEVEVLEAKHGKIKIGKSRGEFKGGLIHSLDSVIKLNDRLKQEGVAWAHLPKFSKEMEESKKKRLARLAESKLAPYVCRYRVSEFDPEQSNVDDFFYSGRDPLMRLPQLPFDDVDDDKLDSVSEEQCTLLIHQALAIDADDICIVKRCIKFFDACPNANRLVLPAATLPQPTLSMLGLLMTQTDHRHRLQFVTKPENAINKFEMTESGKAAAKKSGEIFDGTAASLSHKPAVIAVQLKHLVPPNPLPVFPFNGVDPSKTSQDDCECMVAEALSGREKCVWTIKSCFDFFMQCTQTRYLKLASVSPCKAFHALARSQGLKSKSIGPKNARVWRLGKK